MTGPAPTIRTATLADRPAVVALVRQAFTGDGRDGAEEVAIVTATWESGTGTAIPGLELVAVLGGSVVGHIQTAFGDLDGRPVPAVAPLAVAPNYQGRGIGSALMNEIIERAEALGLPMLVLLGDHDYYRRFGFEPARALGVLYGAAGASDHFLLRPLSRRDPSLRGEFVYHWETPSAEGSE